MATREAVMQAPTIRFGIWCAAAALSVAACGKEEAPPPPIRPVRAIVVEPQASANTYSAPGEIRARYETPIAFRLSGKMIARKVDVGMVVRLGEQIALLDDK